MNANDTIKITGAREHNLKNLNLEIPKNKLVVFTGLSGSGKSTLAFDTLYAEGQRRYMAVQHVFICCRQRLFFTLCRFLYRFQRRVFLLKALGIKIYNTAVLQLFARRR